MSSVQHGENTQMETRMSKTKNTTIKKAKNELESFWREHHQACQASGISKVKYCRQQQLLNITHIEPFHHHLN